MVICSGRNRYVSNKVGKKLRQNVGIVGCNGAFVVSDGELIKEEFLPADFAQHIVEFMREKFNPPLFLLMTKDRNLVLNRTDVSHITNLGYFLYQWVMGTYKEPFVRSDHIFREELRKGKIYKIMVYFGFTKKQKKKAMEANRFLREEFPGAEFSWIGTSIEITPMGCSKAEGLAFYLEHKGFNRDNVLVVGDSGNDISMFQAFPGNSYCMSHGPESVKKRASHIIRRFHELQDFVYPREEKEGKKEK